MRKESSLSCSPLEACSRIQGGHIQFKRSILIALRSLWGWTVWIVKSPRQRMVPYWWESWGCPIPCCWCRCNASSPWFFRGKEAVPLLQFFVWPWVILPPNGSHPQTLLLFIYSFCLGQRALSSKTQGWKEFCIIHTLSPKPAFLSNRRELVKVTVSNFLMMR